MERTRYRSWMSTPCSGGEASCSSSSSLRTRTYQVARRRGREMKLILMSVCRRQKVEADEKLWYEVDKIEKNGCEIQTECEYIFKMRLVVALKWNDHGSLGLAWFSVTGCSVPSCDFVRGSRPSSTNFALSDVSPVFRTVVFWYMCLVCVSIDFVRGKKRRSLKKSSSFVEYCPVSLAAKQPRPNEV